MNVRDAVQVDQTATDVTATTVVSPTHNWIWSARVCVKMSELDGNFFVFIFLGSVPEDSREWNNAPSYVGAFGTYGLGRGANIPAMAEVVTEGSVHLNRALARNYSVRTFDPDDVTPCLKDHLDWRIQMVDGTPVPVEKLPSLEVTVVAVQLAMRVGEVLPEVAKAVVHRDITSGRLGGAHPDCARFLEARDATPSVEFNNIDDATGINYLMARGVFDEALLAEPAAASGCPSSSLASRHPRANSTRANLPTTTGLPTTTARGSPDNDQSSKQASTITFHDPSRSAPFSVPCQKVVTKSVKETVGEQNSPAESFPFCDATFVFLSSSTLTASVLIAVLLQPR
ncbi:hypothetical protein LXA43DRAFT_1091553 [Ganoderma leucocontextum]|nr:hypothetical protein LXA43DRAFT_1091553 [Ganoderma leucocontextum]